MNQQVNSTEHNGFLLFTSMANKYKAFPKTLNRVVRPKSLGTSKWTQKGKGMQLIENRRQNDKLQGFMKTEETWRKHMRRF